MRKGCNVVGKINKKSVLIGIPIITYVFNIYSLSNTKEAKKQLDILNNSD